MDYSRSREKPRSRDRHSRHRSRDRRSPHRHRRRKTQKRSSSSTRSPSPRYKFDSPPKTFVEYNRRVWGENSNSLTPQEYINKIQQVGSTIPSVQAHKIDRELYIGNLPAGITSNQLLEFLNKAMKSRGLQIGEGEPVLSVWISNDGHYAFVEFRSIEETQAGYQLNNITLMNQALRVGKPKSYAGNQPPTVSGLHALSASAVGLDKISEEMASQILGGQGRLMISGIPHGYLKEEMKSVLEQFGSLKCFDMPSDVLTGLTQGYAIFDYEEDEGMASILHQGTLTVSGCEAQISMVGKESLAKALLPPKPDVCNYAKFNSRVLALKNMVKITDLENEEDLQDLHEDVLEECKKYGKVISIVIPRPGEYTSGIGKIFVEFATLEDAIKAKAAISGMKFNEKRVEVNYHPEELFFQGNFTGD